MAYLRVFTMQPTLTRELDVMLTSIRQAGEILLREYADPEGIVQKEDGTPVCQADKKVSAFLCSVLREAFPQYGLLDEEQKDDRSRLVKEYYWAIDPLDGTRDYLEKKEGYSILISLLRQHCPVLAATYQPHKDELAYAIRHKGSFILHNDTCRRLSVSPTEAIDLLVGRTRSAPKLEEIIKQLQPRSISRRGGMIKIVDIAKGQATLCIIPPGHQYHLWDISGPALILEEAGGQITDFYGKPLSYSQGVEFRNGLTASNGVVHSKALSCSAAILWPLSRPPPQT